MNNTRKRLRCSARKCFVWLLGIVAVALLLTGIGVGDVARAGITLLNNPLSAAGITGPQDIPKLVGMILRMAFGIIGTVALVIFIYGGVLWMTAFGEEARVKKGWDTMIWASLGIIVIFGSYVGVDFILKAILG